MSGSCEWFTAKKEFEEWRSSWSSAPSVLWLSGNPASGKSVLSSYVVGYMEEQKLGCSYFFFRQGIENKSSVSDCLRSLAYQMALSNVEVRTKLLTLHADGVSFEKNDEKAIWRKLFLDGVFQARSTQTLYWVIDALDECSKVHSLFSFIANTECHTPPRIFITGRKTQEIERAVGQLGQSLAHVEMQVSDTVNDIKLFIGDRMDRLPVEDNESRLILIDRILAKSNGSFLWVRLVVQELEHACSEEAIEEILTEVPADMNLLYMRTLENMSKVRRETKLAKAILTWTVCASRPLTLSEMQCALKLDIDETVHNLDRLISSICGQLVFIDQRSRIQMVHQTARDFLIQEGLDSEFSIRKAEGHARLAVKCLGYLSGSRFKPQRAQKQKLAIKSGPAKDSALLDYACTFFSDHLYRASSLQSEPWDALYDFLNSNILAWIEHLAKTGDLYYITRTAMNIKAYLARRAKYFPPIGQQAQTVEAWSVDLIRVSAKFRTSLLTSPSSIYWLIPPMCPSESIISRKFTSPHRGLTVNGSVAAVWDDCLTQISYRDSQATAIDHGDRFFAVGLSTGKVFVYHSISGQVNRIVEHLERVKILEFSVQDKFLASGGLRKVHIWDLSTGHQIWSFGTSHQVLALAFTSEDECLLAATQGDYVSCWCLSDGCEKVRIPWHDGFKGEKETNKVRQRPPPTQASFSPDRNLLAVSYRGRSILLFDLESEVFFGDCVRRSALSASKSDTHYPIVAMAFKPNSDVSLLIASYGDGELTVYNSWTLELRHRVSNVNAHTLACSPDGRTLVTGSSFGTILVFDFDGPVGETLTPIYRIDGYEEGIKSLAFSNDSLRFIDIRGSQCRVWEPAVLVRKDLDDCDQSEISDPAPTTHTSVTMAEGEIKAEITAMVCPADGDVIFCGKQDGSVAVYLTQDGQESCVLYKHSTNIAITSVAWGKRESILAGADESSRIVVRRIVRAQTGWSAPEVLVDQRCADSVGGLLISPASDRLLVSGKDFDELWTIRGQKFGSKTSARKNRKAISHPLQPAAFISLEFDVAHIFDWADFKELTDSEGVNLNRFSQPIIRSSSINISYHGRSILAELIKINGDQSSTKLECWQTFNIQANAKSITPLPGFEILGPHIEYVIAVNGNILLFLDTDLWVCSLDLKNFITTPEVKRHFFIPTDWLSTSGEMLFQLTSKNEFIFVKKTGLAIIKRGMDYFETISLSRARQWTFNQGNKLHLTVP